VALLDMESGAGRIPAICLDGRYELLPGNPLEGFRSPAAAAYRVIEGTRSDAALFALICDPGLSPRQPIFHALQTLACDELLALRAWGVVDWPPLARHVIALVFAQPDATRLVPSLSDTVPPLAAAELLGAVVPAVVAALKALHALGITHRAIRPTNLYRCADDGRIMLGECASAPPASDQPIAFEPIESGLAQPLGRGEGTPADDLYALGVTLVHLLRGSDPAGGRSDEAVLLDKIKRGSYAALLGDERPPSGVADLLRGLLADDPRERWTLDDLEDWRVRHRPPVRPSVSLRRAARPLEVGGSGHVMARSLAQAFVSDPAAAEQVIRSGAFGAWLHHSLADPERNTAVVLALADGVSADTPAQSARLVARLAMALDPRAPLRYGGFAAALDGFGPALAAAYRSGSGAAVIADTIMGRLPQFWCSIQPGFRPEQSASLRLFDRLRHWLDDRRPGFGIERLLYELNPGLHCLSPALERDCVIAADGILPALERACAAGRIGEALVDRHVAAFLAARRRDTVSEWHGALASSDPRQRLLGILHVLARLQKLYGPARVPALSERLAHDLPQLLERYHSRSRRRRLVDALARLRGKGDLVETVACIANPGEHRRDEAEFRAARSAFAAVAGALAAMRGDHEGRSREAVVLGGQMTVAAAIVLAGSAAVVSCLVAG
jgi:eukaryotic-like serine/threonine-protein kinase